MKTQPTNILCRIMRELLVYLIRSCPFSEALCAPRRCDVFWKGPGSLWRSTAVGLSDRILFRRIKEIFRRISQQHPDSQITCLKMLVPFWTCCLPLHSNRNWNSECPGAQPHSTPIWFRAYRLHLFSICRLQICLWNWFSKFGSREETFPVRLSCKSNSTRDILFDTFVAILIVCVEDTFHNQVFWITARSENLGLLFAGRCRLCSEDRIERMILDLLRI